MKSLPLPTLFVTDFEIIAIESLATGKRQLHEKGALESIRLLSSHDIYIE